MLVSKKYLKPYNLTYFIRLFAVATFASHMSINNAQAVDSYNRTANSLKGSHEAIHALENILDVEIIDKQ